MPLVASIAPLFMFFILLAAESQLFIQPRPKMLGLQYSQMPELNGILILSMIVLTIVGQIIIRLRMGLCVRMGWIMIGII